MQNRNIYFERSNNKGGDWQRYLDGLENRIDALARRIRTYTETRDVTINNVLDGYVTTIDGYYTIVEVDANLDGYVPITRVVTAGAGMTGGGALSSDITLNVVSGDSIISVAADSISIVQANIDHGSIGGLSDDDHTQYVLAEPSSTDNRLVRWDSTTGRAIQTSAVALTDAGVATGFTGIGIGTTPATAGSLRGNSSFTLQARDTGNTANVTLLSWATNDVTFGHSSYDTVLSGTTITIKGLLWPSADGSSGYVMSTNGSGTLSLVDPLTLSVGDHGNLSGLSDDDHSQYALLAGRSGGQTLYGGNAATQSLAFGSTSHATKGNIVFFERIDIRGNSSTPAGCLLQNTSAVSGEEWVAFQTYSDGSGDIRTLDGIGLNGYPFISWDRISDTITALQLKVDGYIGAQSHGLEFGEGQGRILIYQADATTADGYNLVLSAQPSLTGGGGDLYLCGGHANVGEFPDGGVYIRNGIPPLGADIARFRDNGITFYETLIMSGNDIYLGNGAGSGGNILRFEGGRAINITRAQFDAQTVAGAPSGSTGDIAYFSNGDGGNPCFAAYTGSSWLRLQLGAAISSTVGNTLNMVQLELQSTIPQLYFIENSGGATSPGANESIWKFRTDGGTFQIQTRTDADGSGATALQITRSGTSVSQILLNSDVEVNGPLTMNTYTVAGAPTASSYTGSIIYVSNGDHGGPCMAFSDGSNWNIIASSGAISAT